MVAGLERMLTGSAGMQANRMLDALGLPDNIGDMIGAQMDLASGDMAGYARNMLDLTSGMNSGQLDALFGKGLVAPHFAPKPSDMLSRSRQLWGQKFSTPFGTHEVSRQQLGGGGLVGGMVGQSMERAMMQNPAFKAQMEQLMGGRILLDGRADGKITVHRFKPNFSQVPLNKAISSNPMLSGIYQGLSRMEGNIKNLMGGLLNQGANKSGGTAQQALKNDEMGQMAGEMGMTPPMSFEDLLFLLMLKYAKKKEGEIMNMAKQLTRGKSGEQTPGSLVGNGQIGGQQAAGGGQAAGGAQGGYDPLDPNQSDTTKQAMLQKMMQDLQKVYQLLTNMMKSMHDMSMASVRNIR